MCGIEYNFQGFPMEKTYQINNGLDNTLPDMWRIQRTVSNCRRYQRTIQRQRRHWRQIWFNCVGSVWLNSLSQYIVGLMILIFLQKRHIKLMMDWVILYKIGESFNGDSIRNELNSKLKAEDILNWFVWLAVCGWILNLNIVDVMILQQ